MGELQPPLTTAILSSPLQALVIPHPLQGHITPLLQFSAKLASSYNVHITFIVTNHLVPKMNTQVLSSLPITMVGLPDNLPPDHARQSTFLDSYEMVMGLEASVHDFLHDLAQRNQLPSFILADTFVTWTHKVACKYSVPHVAFVTTNVAAMAVMSSTSKLIDLGILPVKTANGSPKLVGELITCVPGIPHLHPNDLPLSLRSPSITYYRMQFVIAQFAEASKAVAVVVNSVTELEGSALAGLELRAPTFCVGPALILNGEELSLQGMGSSLWPEERGCILWLNKQEQESVLYVSFGSVASLDRQQLAEIAYGLEASGQPFLWVIHPESFEGLLSDVLPEGFLERTQNRGYIVAWCPQLLVLSHGATGGFLTHCGWNSILENICLGGVPMICWPHASEQAVNARVIVDVWRVGLKVHKEENEVVKREEVERVVRAVMQGEEAKEFKYRAGDMRNTARRAVQEGGSSLKNIEKVLDIVRKAKQP